MSDIVIQVENLSKRYVLSHQSKRLGDSDRITDLITRAVQTPFRRLQGQIDPEPTHEEFWALKDVSFEVKQGEVIGIIGRNGAGKSTLLKILSRITEPTSGRAVINGRVASLLEVGTGFHPELTGRENIYLNGAILGLKQVEIKKVFDEIVAFAEVEKFLDTPVKHYSSGMYVRLAFAVAAHLEPEILIVDEVLAVGDAQFQKKCLGKMQDVSKKEGRTVLFVSHNIDAISKLCQRCILLQTGRVAHIGSTNETLDKYLNLDESIKTEFPIFIPSEKDAAAKATMLNIEDLDGKPANGFAVGRPWQIRVSFSVVQSVKNFIVGLTLVSNRGLVLWTMWTKPFNLEPGHYQSVFRNEKVLLCSGTYSTIVGLNADPGLKTLHLIPEAGSLVISEINEVPEAVIAGGAHGFLANPTSTKILTCVDNSEMKANTLAQNELTIF